MPRKFVVAIALFLVAVLLAGGAFALGGTGGPGEVQARLAGAEVLGGANTSGFATASAPRQFAFPADHGPHPEFRNEWWYFTGNLETAEGRHFGYQLTFFRTALSPESPARESEWATNQVYMAHFTVTDVETGQFHAFERFSRGAVGLAGAQAQPLRVWLEDWSVAAPPGATGQEPQPPLRLQAAQDGVAVDLSLESLKPVVLQGDAGLSQKGAEPGNASYYYSLTRVQTSGTVAVGGQSYQVDGLTWMDREWSTSALSEDEAGWDWFSLQLGDGRELMYYQLRRKDGTVEPFSGGTLVLADGSVRRLGPGDVAVEVLDHWTSPRDGASYPAKWRLRVPSAQLDLELTPYVADQELDVTVRYWEGAVRAQGTSAGSPVAGSGYVELTGYADGGIVVR
ncbi:MAG: hypothetical protein M0Z94_20645 [Dehalococcoidales bacterium]|nr:hypothetical protein [Dehalococcoidales bacterium]